MNKPRIMSLGEVLWDLFPEGPRFGGAPANFACHAALLGGDVTMVSAVGDDERGHEAMRILNKFGINTELMQINKNAPTGTVGIVLDKNAKPTFSIHQNSAWDQLSWTPKLADAISSLDAIYFGTLGLRDERARQTIFHALEAAKIQRIPRILDVNLRAPFYDDKLICTSIEYASVLKLSNDELATVSSACKIERSENQPDMLRALLHKFELDAVVMTRGGEGALLVTNNSIFDQPGIPATVVDTVGAGDSFTAAFMLGHLRGDNYDTILVNACTIASKVCAQVGAVPQ